MKDKLGQEPVFPIINLEGIPTNINSHYLQGTCTGINKRFYAACAAMQGLIASNAFMIYNTKDQEVCAKLSYQFANELLKQENE